MLLLPVVIVAINEGYIIDQTLPDAGNVNGARRHPYYRTVTDISSRHHLQFAVQAANDACLLLSETQTTNMEYNTDHSYLEICLGESLNTRSMIISNRAWTPYYGLDVVWFNKEAWGLVDLTS